MARFADYNENKAFQMLTERIEKRRLQRQKTNLSEGRTKKRNSEKSST